MLQFELISSEQLIGNNMLEIAYTCKKQFYYFSFTVIVMYSKETDIQCTTITSSSCINWAECLM